MNDQIHPSLPVTDQSTTPMPPVRPRRAVTMTLTIGADTRLEMALALQHLAFEIEAGQINGPSGCSGGPFSGYSYDFTAAEHPTHDEYIAQLNAYLEKTR